MTWHDEVNRTVGDLALVKVHRAQSQSLMATLTESEAVFESKLKELGLEGKLADMKAKGWRTLATFAFSSSWAPGTGDDTFLNQVVIPILGRQDHSPRPAKTSEVVPRGLHHSSRRTTIQTGRDSGG